MMLLYHILRKCPARYKLSKSWEKINHLIDMDDIKLFAKNEKELLILIQTVRIYSQDIEMEFGIENCTMLIMKSSKRHRTEGVRYSGPFLKLTRELKQMDKRTRKLMTIHKALHPSDDIHRLYVSRKVGGRGLARIEDIIDASIQRLEDYRGNCGGKLITPTRSNTDDTRISRTTITRKQKWTEKQLYGRFKRITSDISHEKMWTCLRKGNLKRETESLLVAAQNNAIMTNHIKVRIDKTQQNSRWGLCGERDETINHIISECSKLAQKEYKTRHAGVGKVIHREVLKKLKSDHTNKWYMYNPKSVLENETHKLLWDTNRSSNLIIENFNQCYISR